MSRSTQRNVLVIIADDWSPIAGCYGNPIIQTPNVDQFARQATLFRWGFCTSASWAVSRASLLTGMYSHTHGQYGHCHGIHGFRTHEHLKSIPGLLGDAGYATMLLGKKHFEPASVYPLDFEPHVNERSPADVQACLEQLLTETRDRPFYAQVASTYPHRAARGYANHIVESGINPVTYDPADVPVPGFLPDNDATRDDLAEYYQSISRWDQVVGAALTALQRSGRADDTLVMVLSDHGMPFPGAKASSYDNGHHCPLLVRSPAAPRRGIENQALVNWCDLAPTIYQWTAVNHPEPDQLPGRSILPILADDSPQPGGGAWEQTWFSHCFHEITNYYPYRVLRSRRYKYVRNLAHQLPHPLPTDLFRSVTWTRVREQQIEQLGQRRRAAFMQQEPEKLYDMQADPWETTNRINDPALREVAASMRQQMLDWREATKDPWLEQSFQQGEISAERRAAMRGIS